MPEEERPRERLMREGADALALGELIAIILGTGTRGKSALGLADELLSRFRNLDGLLDATVAELTEMKGMGRAKAIKLKAVFAIAKRSRSQIQIGKSFIHTAEDAYSIALQEIGSEKQEVVLVILRDCKHRLIHYEKVAIGTLSEVLVHPREIFYPAVHHKAHSLFICHNHPSGDPTPSEADLELTRLLERSGRMMGIELAGHLILGRDGFIAL